MFHNDCDAVFFSWFFAAAQTNQLTTDYCYCLLDYMSMGHNLQYERKKTTNRNKCYLIKM